VASVAPVPAAGAEPADTVVVVGPAGCVGDGVVVAALEAGLEGVVAEAASDVPPVPLGVAAAVAEVVGSPGVRSGEVLETPLADCDVPELLGIRAAAAWICAASCAAKSVGSGAWMFATARPASPPGWAVRNTSSVGEDMTIPIPAASRSILWSSDKAATLAWSNSF